MITLLRSCLLMSFIAGVLCGQRMELLTGPGEGSYLNQHTVLQRGSTLTKSGGPRKITVFSADVILPQLVDGGAWTTSFVFTDMDTKVLKFSVYYFADDGSDLYLTIVEGSGRPARGMNVTLDPGTTIKFSTNGAPPHHETGVCFTREGPFRMTP